MPFTLNKKLEKFKCSKESMLKAKIGQVESRPIASVSQVTNTKEKYYSTKNINDKDKKKKKKTQLINNIENVLAVRIED